MLEVVTKRRRWPRWALATVGLLIGVPVAWHLRPLNSMERRLVGVWEGGSSVSLRQLHQLTFTPDRRYRRVWLRDARGDVVTRGSWRVSGDRLMMREDFEHSRHRETLVLRVWRHLTEPRDLLVDEAGPKELRLVEEAGRVLDYSRRFEERQGREVTRIR